MEIRDGMVIRGGWPMSEEPAHDPRRRPAGEGSFDQGVLDRGEPPDDRRADQLLVQPRRKIVSHRGSLACTSPRRNDAFPTRLLHRPSDSQP
jgi:hypothetical protein